MSDRHPCTTNPRPPLERLDVIAGQVEAEAVRLVKFPRIADMLSRLARQIREAVREIDREQRKAKDGAA